MLNWMRGVILRPVQGLTVAQLDYLHDAKANTIGALLLHLAAIERLYQIHTFEGKKWNDWDDTTKKQWDIAASLGKDARKSIKGHNLAYYLDKLREVREHTLASYKNAMTPGSCKSIPPGSRENRRTITASGFTCANTNQTTTARSNGSKAGCRRERIGIAPAAAGRLRSARSTLGRGSGRRAGSSRAAGQVD